VKCGFRLSDVPVPVRYFREASSINFARSTTYGLMTVKTVLQYWLWRLGVPNRLFAPKLLTAEERSSGENDSPQRAQEGT